MHPNRNTPFKRFSALWIGIGLSLSFGLGLFIFVIPFLKDDITSDDDRLQARYDERLEIKKQVDEAQESQLSEKINGDVAQVSPEKAFSYTIKNLLTEKPQAILEASQVVPGSETAKRLSESSN